VVQVQVRSGGYKDELDSFTTQLILTMKIHCDSINAIKVLWFHAMMAVSENEPTVTTR
jgi:uncharacterized protein with FMN-binding domain